jgi:gliding motility-associated-like protein
MFLRKYTLATTLAILLCTFGLDGRAQAITNAGTDFWLGYNEVLDDTHADYWLNISSKDTANVTVEIPGTGFSTTQQIAPNVVTRFNLPPNDCWIFGSDTIWERAIHVTSDSNVVVYAITYFGFRHEASLVLPTNAWGTRYRAMTYASENKAAFGETLRESEFIVVSGMDTVEVEITPSADGKGGLPAGTPYSVTIPPQSIYQLLADSVQDDLTGTLIESTNPNVPFAVFAGNEWSTIVCTPNSDPLYEQMFPTSTWGKEYIVIPTPTVDFDYIRVMADADSTFLLRNDTLVDTLMAGEFFEDTVSSPTLYTGSNRISVGYFMVTGSAFCSGRSNTDPSMIMLNPNEQMFLDSITFFSVDHPALLDHFINVVTRTVDTNDMFFDGVKLDSFLVFPHDTTYSYRSIAVNVGSHTLETGGCGFVAYSLGLGVAVSYAYAAGVLLTDLDNQVSFENVSTGSDTICTNDSIQFRPGIFGNPISFLWEFSDGTSYTVQQPRKKFDTSGTFTYRLVTEYQCFNDTVLDTIQIRPSPEIDLGEDTLVCSGPPLILDAGYPDMIWVWSTGDTSQQLAVTRSGTYSVIVSNLICFDFDTIEVELPQIGASFEWLKGNPDRPDICVDEEVLFFNEFLGTPIDFRWEFGDGNEVDDAPQIRYAYGSGGDFVVSLLPRFECGPDTVTLAVTDTLTIVPFPTVDLGEDTFLCLPDTMELRVSNAERIIWEPGGSEDTVLRVTETEFITVFAENRSCPITDSVYIDVPVISDVIPNVFTPNGDGVNDVFTFAHLDRCENHTLKVFNRWGVEVFESVLIPGESWDGRGWDGRPVTEGVYFYILEGNGVEHAGHITLIR